MPAKKISGPVLEQNDGNTIPVLEKKCSIMARYCGVAFGFSITFSTLVGNIIVPQPKQEIRNPVLSFCNNLEVPSAGTSLGAQSITKAPLRGSYLPTRSEHV